jgi:hypothetical protein
MLIFSINVVLLFPVPPDICNHNIVSMMPCCASPTKLVARGSLGEGADSPDHLIRCHSALRRVHWYQGFWAGCWKTLLCVNIYVVAGCYQFIVSFPSLDLHIHIVASI